MAVDLRIPESGESITEVQIGDWFKTDGDYVEADEIVVEIETDKASMELPAPASGILKIEVHAGDGASVGDVIARIDDSAAKPADDQRDRKKAQTKAEAAESTTDNGQSATATQSPPKPDGAPATERDEIIVMPGADRLIHDNNLNPADIRGTGPGGRILKEDVLRHLEKGSDTPAPAPSPAPAASGDREEETVPMTMLRRRIAERLVDAQQTAALLTTFNEIDMSAAMALRKQYQDQFVEKYGIKLGFMSLFVKAAIDALKLIPQVNAEIRGTDIVYKNYYDIGVAVGTDKGLVVPVVRHAERLSFAEIEQQIAELAKKARDRKLSLEELQGGTFTISNGGVYGSLMSTPIINPPQSAILGLHAIQDRPVARDGQVVIRPMMYVALTYDHRIIDGKESVTFLKRIKECMEDPQRMLVEV